MKNSKPKTKRTVFKITFVLVLITGALVFLLPSRCKNENAKTEIPRPEDMSFESGRSTWVEPEKADSRAERHDEAPPAPFTVIAPVETPEKSVTDTSENINEVAILPAKNESGSAANSIPDAAIAEVERTAATEAIPVIGETAQGESANIQAEEAKAVTDKSANETITETAYKTNTLPPEVIASKIDAVPPKTTVSTSGIEMPEEERNKDTAFVVAANPESLKTTVGMSKERAAPDVKNMSGTGSTSTTQRASPSFAGDKGTIDKRELPPPKDTTSKSIQPVVVTSHESQTVTGQQSKEAEKSGALVPETKPEQEITKDETISPASKADTAEPPQTGFDSRGKTEQKVVEKVGGFSIGLLFEGNRAAREGWGMETGLILGYEITGSLSAGIKGAYGTDFHGIEYFEGLLYGRYYLPFKKEEFGIFAQVGVGGITVTEEREKTQTSMIMDISLGARFFLGNFYIEPYLRVGYMIQAGAGLAFGYRVEG
jgi:hypothetical protein